MLALCLLLWASCSDDDVYDSYRYDFADVETSAAGESRMFLDGGDTLRVSTQSQFTFPADTTVRYIVCYVETSVNEALVSSAAKVLTGSPITVSESELQTDALGVQSVWIGGHYINLRLSVPVTGESHTFGFARTSDESPLRLTLYHSAGSGSAVYHRTTYLSCDLSDCLTRGDSVYFTVNDETEGTLTYNLQY